MGETRRRSTEPRLTLVSFKICSKLSLNTLDNHFIPFLTGQQSSQLRSMPKNCAFYTNDGNLRKSWAFLDIVYYKSNSFYSFSAERLWQGLYRRKKQNKSGNFVFKPRGEHDEQNASMNYVVSSHLSPRPVSENISFSIEEIQYYVLFNIIAGPEAVLRQPLEDMKVF